MDFKTGLSGNEIEQLDTNLFNGLNKAKFIYLHSNKFKSIPKELFNNLNNLNLTKCGVNLS